MKVSCVCVHCNKNFVTKVSQKRYQKYGLPKFCSTKCRKEHYTAVCSYCGKIFHCPPSVVNQRKSKKVFCSNNCRNAFFHPQRTCKQCGKVLFNQRWAKDRPFCSRKCYSEYLSLNNCQENHPRWTGGFANHTGREWRQAQRLVRKRDNNTCQLCGVTAKQLGKNMDVHHIIPFRISQNHSPDNLICLCPSCHTKLDSEIYWHSSPCGYTANADINACRNIRQVYLDTLPDGPLSTGPEASTACG